MQDVVLVVDVSDVHSVMTGLSLFTVSKYRKTDLDLKKIKRVPVSQHDIFRFCVKVLIQQFEKYDFFFFASTIRKEKKKKAHLICRELLGESKTWPDGLCLRWKWDYYMQHCYRLALRLCIISNRGPQSPTDPPPFLSVLCPSISVHIHATCSTALPEATADFRCCLQTSPLLRPLWERKGVGGGRGGVLRLTDLTAAG